MKKRPQAGSNSANFSFRGQVWIAKDKSTFLGSGRITLLEKIKECGSITEAAKSMDMSYKHAWDLIDSMNSKSEKPLVVTSTGGKGGGGAKLTEAGQRAIDIFHAFHRDFRQFLRREENKFEL